jgi:circadian clock protein KaiB
MKSEKRRVAKKPRVERKKRVAKRKEPVWELRLYVADTTPRSVLATGNLRSFCEQYLRGQYRITIIDLVKQPALARRDEITATPTLVRVLPAPQRIVIGSLSDTERVCKALDLGDQPDNLLSVLSQTAPQVGNA